MDGEHLLRALTAVGVVACILLFAVGFAAPILPPELAGFVHNDDPGASTDVEMTPASTPVPPVRIASEATTLPPADGTTTVTTYAPPRSRPTPNGGRPPRPS